jgi:hypothetical protein
MRNNILKQLKSFALSHSKNSFLQGAASLLRKKTTQGEIA